jgi:hypothetical protein
MTSTKNILILLTALAAGCATPTTGVVPLSDGLAKITRQGSGAWVTTADLKALVMTDANAWCESKKKSVKVIDVKEVQARPFGGWPEAEVLFKCE